MTDRGAQTTRGGGGGTVFSMNGAGETGYPHAGNEPRLLPDIVYGS